MNPTRTSCRRLAVVALALVLGAGACASAGSPAGALNDPNRLTAAELEDSNETELLAVIQRLRPRWLQTRGSATFGGRVGATVLIDDLQQPTGVGALRNVRVADVEEVVYLSAGDATTRYGTNMAGGAILVTLKR